MRIGSRSLGEFPSTVVRIECQRCGRAGSYRLDGLLARFGPDAALPDVLMALATCERRRDFSRPCGARFTDLADAAHPPRRSPGHSAGRLSCDGGDYRRNRPGRRPKHQSARQHRTPLRRRDMLRPENCRGLAALASADSEPALKTARPLAKLTHLWVCPLIDAPDPGAIATKTEAPVAVDCDL